MAHAASLTGDIADFKRRECEGRTIAASSHNPKDHPRPLRTSSLNRSARGAQEGRPDDASDEISGAIEGEKYRRDCIGTTLSIVLGVWGCPKSTLPKLAKCFEILVSAAGFEPATHALKGRSIATTLYMFQ